MKIEYLINLLVAIIPAVIAYFAATKQYQIKLELAKEQNKIEFAKVKEQLKEERHKTDTEIEKIKTEKDRDIAKIEAETEKEIKLLKAKSKTRQGETLENKMFDAFGDQFLEAFKENIDFGDLIKKELKKKK